MHPRLIPLKALTLVALPSLTMAQGTDVRGMVSDSTTGERLPYVTIAVTGIALGAVTNTNGFFLIPNVPLGTHEFTASSIGYQSKTKIVTVHGGSPIILRFQLVQKPVEISEVVVRGRREGGQSQASASLHPVAPQEIERIPAAAQSDLFRAIQVLPGVLSIADVNSKFYVRGGAGDQNLVLLDGMKIYNPFHAFGIFSVFDPDIIKSVDLYTGAFPPGYGDRLSSVLDVTTRDGDHSRVAGRANLNFISTKLQLEGPFKEENTWILNGRKSVFNRTFRTFVKDTPPISFYDVFFKVNLGWISTGRESFQGFISGDNIISKNPDEPDYFWRNQAIAASVAGLVHDRVYVDGVFYSNRFQVRRDAKQSTVVRPAQSNVEEIGIRGNLTFYTESRDTYIGGFELGIPKFDNKFVNGANVEQVFSTVNVEPWLWLRYLTTMDNVAADIGLHSDVLSLMNRGINLVSLQPRASARYEFTEDVSLKASVGVFSQNVITLNNEDDVISLFEGWIFIPDYLKPEEAFQYVFGMEGTPSSSLFISLQGYYKDYRSLVLYNRDKIYPFEPDYINGKGKAYGIETMFRTSFPGIDFYATYSLGRTETTIGNFTYSPRYDRRHSMNLLMTIRPVRDVEISFRWEYGSGYPFTQTVGYYDRLTFQDVGLEPLYGETGSPYSILGPKNAGRLPAYHRLDASAAHKFSIPPIRGFLGVNIMNLYNSRNVLFFDRKNGQRIDMLPFFPSAVLTIDF